jgi:hypothetical protein
MQPATVDQVASEAALLSWEQLQSLARAANVLGREVEEVTSDVTDYIQQLQGLSPAALAAETCDTVQKWMERAAGAEAVAAGLPTAAAAAVPPDLLWQVRFGPKTGGACQATGSTAAGDSAVPRKPC